MLGGLSPFTFHASLFAAFPGLRSISIRNTEKVRFRPLTELVLPWYHPGTGLVPENRSRAAEAAPFGSQFSGLVGSDA